jgi:membrane protein implicated in regulation of membrane protease activity
MKIAFFILLLLHGLIHLMGFLKAFNLAEIPQLSQNFSKPQGVLWLAVALAFVITAILFLLKNNLWFWIAIAAVIVSQVLIIVNWQDAKFGTLANLIVLIVALLAMAGWNFEREFKKDVSQSFKNVGISEEIISEADIAQLPIPVQNYLKYVGAIGKPKIKTARAIFKGEMREKGKDWFAFTSEQYNFFEDPTRLFFMKANFKGLPTQGYHWYKEGKASMLIKLLSVFPVVDISEPEMFKTESVTFFNDMCLFAPAALVDKRIDWQTLGNNSVKAVFYNGEVSVSAILKFDESGRLINFISEDRVDVNSNQNLPFSTPVTEYGTVNCYKLPIAADAVWHFPDGDFVYGKFYLQDVQYNLKISD